MGENSIHSTLACNLDIHILQAAFPLLAAGEIEAIEWSFDSLYRVKKVPTWFIDFISAFSDGNRLIGHGVYYSFCSGKWLPEQDLWLQKLEALCEAFTFTHLTEHFGFMTGENFHHGAPMSTPFTSNTLAIGRDRLNRLVDVCRCPIGLENLAFAFSIDDVKRQGAFLSELISPFNGFIILDLHNIYCQAHNFNISCSDIIDLYPLDLVREVHISGGSWESTALNKTKKVRRDTHDERVPKEVFKLLESTLLRCPNVRFVTLEQIGGALRGKSEIENYQTDFLTMKAIVQKAKKHTVENEFTPNIPDVPEKPIENLTLYNQQMTLSAILEKAASHDDALLRLDNAGFKRSDWRTENWKPHMLETAMKIAKKWAEPSVRQLN